MKKFMFTFFIAAASMAVNAQTFGVHANGILASAKSEEKDQNTTLSTKLDSRFSWKAGVVGDIPIAENFSFMPQLNILSKGGKLSQSEAGFTSSMEMKFTYLELPLNLVFSHTSGLFIGAGPSLSYGIGGEAEVTVSGGGLSETGTVKIKFDGDDEANDDNAHLKALELGANVIAGYRLSNGLFFNVQYNQGLSNIDPSEGSSFKNKYFGFGIGYFFGAQ